MGCEIALIIKDTILIIIIGLCAAIFILKI